MDAIPKRSIIASPYRYVLQHTEKHLVFPFKNPDVYTIASVLLSIPLLVVESIQVRLVLVLLILLCDWLDGAAARRFKTPSRRGYVVDVMFDRLSDGIVAASVLGTTYGKFLFLLYLANNFLTFYSAKTGKHRLLAVRFFYFVILLIQLFSPNFLP